MIFARFRNYLHRHVQNYLRAVAEALPPPPTPYYRVEAPPKDKAEVVYDNHLLSGKTVLVTAAGQNIGRSIAIEMAKQGATIYFTEIDTQRCDEVEKELQKLSPHSKGFYLDILKTDERHQLLQYFDDQDLNIDVLVNNLGRNGATVKVEDLEIEEWEETFKINLFGPVALTKEIVSRMIERKINGNVIFLTSINQQLASRWPSYSSAKATLASIVKEFAIDLAPTGIRVNGIAPGHTDLDESGLNIPSPETPLYQTTIDPDYIGRAAVYLSTEYFSRHTTGSILIVDGGRVLVNARSQEITLREGLPLSPGIP
ncbi:MAG: SDR family oxidoreductase [Chloroflexota bacterium]